MSGYNQTSGTGYGANTQGTKPTGQLIKENIPGTAEFAARHPQADAQINRTAQDIKGYIPGTQEHQARTGANMTGTGVTGTGVGGTHTGVGGRDEPGYGSGTGTGMGGLGTGTGLGGVGTGTGMSGIGTGTGYGGAGPTTGNVGTVYDHNNPNRPIGEKVAEAIPGTEAHRERRMENQTLGGGYGTGGQGTGFGTSGMGTTGGVGTTGGIGTTGYGDQQKSTGQKISEHIPGTAAYKERKAEQGGTY